MMFKLIITHLLLTLITSNVFELETCKAKGKKDVKPAENKVTLNKVSPKKVNHLIF